MGSLAFLPLGYVLAGPLADAIGVSTTLWLSVGYIGLSTTAILLVPGVRNLRRVDARPQAPPLPAPATL
jgi:MFS family permease